MQQFQKNVLASFLAADFWKMKEQYFVLIKMSMKSSRISGIPLSVKSPSILEVIADDFLHASFSMKAQKGRMC